PRVEVEKSQTRVPPGDYLVQVAVAVEHDGVVIPRLPRPEPNPSRPAYESADEDEYDPHEESPEEHRDGELPLLPCVVAVAQRVRVNIGEDHQPDDEKARHHDARDPGVEVDEHLLKSEEVPRRFRRVHRQVWVRGFFERRVDED